MALTRCSRREQGSANPPCLRALAPHRASPAQEAHPVPHPQASKVLAAGELLHDTTTPREGPVATRKPHHDTTPPRAMPPHSPTGDATTSRERPVATPCDRGMQAAPRHHPAPHEATPAQRAMPRRRAKGPSQRHAIAACKPHHDITPPRTKPPQPNGRCHDVARKARRNAMRSRHASRTTTSPRPARSHPSPTGDATTSRERPVATPCDRGMQAAPRHHPAPHEATPAQRATYDVARKARRNAMRSRHASRTTTPPRPARSHPSSTGEPHHDATTPRELPHRFYALRPRLHNRRRRVIA
ncbi:hypothetical protein EDB85DRAFT_2141654 [Lactarius pseudohatsudake]|nr:hypothetical protein EDB85DRAFT_2141654 [Lactarius pseudohatsudake]